MHTMQIAEAMARFVGQGPEFDPAAMTRRTLRQYLEGLDDFEGPELAAVQSGNFYETNHVCGLVNRCGPLQARPTLTAPVALERFGCWEVLRVYWRGLSRLRKARIDVDHSPGLDWEHWPILKALTDDFNAATGLSMDVCNALGEMFCQDFCDLPENWELSYMAVPMYDGEVSGDGTTAIVFLENVNQALEDPENMQIQWPPEVYEFVGDEQLNRACEALVSRLKKRVIRDIQEPWLTAFSFLKTWKHNYLVMWDYYANLMAIREPEDINLFFRIYKDYHNAIQAVQPVYELFESCEDTQAVWRELIEALLGEAVRPVKRKEPWKVRVKV